MKHGDELKKMQQDLAEKIRNDMKKDILEDQKVHSIQ